MPKPMMNPLTLSVLAMALFPQLGLSQGLELRGGPLQPEVDQVLGPHDIPLTTLHLALHNGDEDPITIQGLSLTIRVDGDGDIVQQVILTTDPLCDGDEGNPAQEMAPESGQTTLAFALDDAIPSGERRCYLVQMRLFGDICPCETYGLEVAPADIVAQGATEPTQATGETLFSHWRAPAATLDMITETPLTVFHHESQDLVVRLGDIRERCHGDWMARYTICASPSDGALVTLDGQYPGVDKAFSEGEFTSVAFLAEDLGPYRVCAGPRLAPDSPRQCPDLQEEDFIFDIDVLERTPTPTADRASPSPSITPSAAATLSAEPSGTPTARMDPPSPTLTSHVSPTFLVATPTAPSPTQSPSRAAAEESVSPQATQISTPTSPVASPTTPTEDGDGGCACQTGGERAKDAALFWGLWMLGLRFRRQYGAR